MIYAGLAKLLTGGSDQQWVRVAYDLLAGVEVAIGGLTVLGPGRWGQVIYPAGVALAAGFVPFSLASMSEGHRCGCLGSVAAPPSVRLLIGGLLGVLYSRLLAWHGRVGVDKPDRG